MLVGIDEAERNGLDDGRGNQDLRKKASMKASSYPLIMTEGGDDRLVLNATGTNKYHCRPEPAPHAVFRGSCTCNIPTEEAYAAAEAAFESLMREEVSVADIMEGVRSRLKSLYDLPAGTEVFLCPSGSDAEYIPLLIVKTLNKGRKIVNIVTCDAEVGSGTYNAAGGRYFSSVYPINDESNTVKPSNGSPVEGLSEGVETVSVPARSDKDGDVLDAADPVQETVDRCAKEDAVPIVHCVVGSKTGIYEPYPSTHFGNMVATRDAFIVVDACQGRFRKQSLHEYLDKGAFVLITGSKFYRGPPFSGAVLVPRPIMERLVLTDVDMPAGLRRFLTCHEVPRSLPSWGGALLRRDNVGLALRWVAALAEMEPALAIDDDIRDDMSQLWREHCLSEIRKYPDQLDAFEPGGRKTIVSIRLRRPRGGAGGGGAYLRSEECRKVFECMPRDLSRALGGAAAAAECYIGQPVSITKDECVVRIAMGSDTLRGCLGDPRGTLAQDSVLIRKLALVTEHLYEL